MPDPTAPIAADPSTAVPPDGPAPISAPVHRTTPPSPAPSAPAGQDHEPSPATAPADPGTPSHPAQPATPVALDTRDAAAHLGALPGPGARGFLGVVDPVTQNTALIARQLDRIGARVLRVGDTLLGYAANPDQPRQARIATTGDGPEPVRALLEHLHTYHRCTSFVAEVPEGAPALRALEASGFTRTGTLPGHVYHSGGHHDVLVYCAAREG